MIKSFFKDHWLMVVLCTLGSFGCVWAIHAVAINDQEKRMTRECGHLGFYEVYVDHWNLNAFCVDKDSKRMSLYAAEDLRKAEMAAREFVSDLFGPIEAAFARQVINCVPVRFTTDGSTSHFLCKEVYQPYDGPFCEEINSKFGVVSRDFQCMRYQQAEEYALSAGAKFDASTGRTLKPDLSEFHEDCIILELDPDGVPLRRLCKLVTNKKEGQVTSCSVRLEENMHVKAAYDDPLCEGFNKAQKTHATKS